MDSHCTRYRSNHNSRSAARRARREASSARPVASLVSQASSPPASTSSSSPSLLNNRCHPASPTAVPVQSSSCRAIEHRNNRTAAIDQRPVAIPASFESGMVPQEQPAARIGASQRTVKHELSPRTTVPHTMPHPYSACRCRNRIPAPAPARQGPRGMAPHRSRCGRGNP